MADVRELLRKPAIAWAAAGICVAFSVVMLARAFLLKSPYDVSRLSETITVRFTDTDEEVTMQRADFEKQLRESPGPLSADKGIVNPKTGKPTGVLVATNEWKEVVNRLNNEREWLRQNSAFGGAPSGPPSNNAPNAKNNK